jgi:uncharacterized protein YjbI with pentapeptide repeats
VLRQLDGERKGLLLRFLYESELIGKPTEAEGEEDQKRATVDLYGASLRGADLNGADLRGADLNGADLRGADLNGADLSIANLYGADLSGADLNGATVTDEQLAQARSLEGATMPDGIVKPKEEPE